MRNLLRRFLFSKQKNTASFASSTSSEEHALIVDTVGVTVTPEEVFAVEDDLNKALELGGAGMVDGHEMAVDGSHAIFYMYGQDAEALLEAALPVLQAHRVTKTGRALLRFGSASDLNASVQEVMISETTPLQ